MSRRAGTQQLDEQLRALAALLAPHVSAEVVDELLGYVDACEAEVGLEQLCDTLSDDEEPLTVAEVELIREIGTALGLTRPSFRDLGELAVSD
ncbi:MafI family immunity protein [Streptomyces sp. NPDC055749]